MLTQVPSDAASRSVLLDDFTRTPKAYERESSAYEKIRNKCESLVSLTAGLSNRQSMIRPVDQSFDEIQYDKMEFSEIVGIALEYFLKNFFRGFGAKTLLDFVTKRSFAKLGPTLRKEAPRFASSIGLISAVYQFTFCLLNQFKMKHKDSRLSKLLSRRVIGTLSALLCTVPVVLIMTKQE